MPGNVIKKLKPVLVTGLFLLLKSKLLSRLSPFKQPPLLILSYPRSGSSWVGKVLAASPDTAYLREPITQPYMVKHGGKYALVDVDHDKSAFSIYRKLSDEAFRGSPSRHPDVVNNLRDFIYPNRNHKRVMIKEVNPRATRFYCELYNPKVVFLLRHPAAIALSFYQLGWLKSPDVQMETGNPKANEWEKFGYTYGVVMHNAIETLKSHGNHEVVVYRPLAEEPRTGFKKLFEAVDLALPENYDKVIDRYCYSSKDTTHKGEVERTSKNMVFKWRDELTEQQISDLRAGFVQSPLMYYRQEDEWMPADSGSNS